MENAVEKAIRLLGGSLQATIKTGIHGTTLWKWAKAGKIKDGARAVLVSRATGGQVSVEELVGWQPLDENGGEPTKGKRFPVKDPSSATYHVPAPILPELSVAPPTDPSPAAASLAA